MDGTVTGPEQAHRRVGHLESKGGIRNGLTDYWVLREQLAAALRERIGV